MEQALWSKIAPHATRPSTRWRADRIRPDVRYATVKEKNAFATDRASGSLNAATAAEADIFQNTAQDKGAIRMNKNENRDKIETCKWRNPRAAWVPIFYAILLGVASIFIFSVGTGNAEIDGMRIGLSLTFGIMAVSMGYLVLKKGQSSIAKAITLLCSLATIIMFFPSVRSADAIGAIIFAAFIGIPINYFWDHVCKKISG